jgi:hypothetical protein
LVNADMLLLNSLQAKKAVKMDMSQFIGNNFSVGGVWPYTEDTIRAVSVSGWLAPHLQPQFVALEYSTTTSRCTGG